jgi:hypothetical protein
MAVGSALALFALLAQDFHGPTLLEMARRNGGVSRMVLSCGPLATIETLVNYYAFGFEGRVLEAESRLTSDQRDLYTEYTFDLVRVLHQGPLRVIEGIDASKPYPLVFAPPQPRPGPTGNPRVRVRAPVGRVEIEGLTITASANDLPVFKVGQHLVVFAFYSEHYRYWQVAVNGVLEVRPKGLVSLTRSLKVDYESVDALDMAIRQLVGTKRQP